MPRILPEGCLWGACAIFEHRRGVLWLHLTLVWAAVRSLWLHQSTVGREPQYCGQDPQYCGRDPQYCGSARERLCKGRSGMGACRSRQRSRNGTCGACALFTLRCEVLWLGLTLVWVDSGSRPRCRPFGHCGMVTYVPCANTRCGCGQEGGPTCGSPRGGVSLLTLERSKGPET